MSMRNPNIGVLVAVTIIIGGMLLLDDAGEAAMQLVTLVGLAAGFAVLHILDEPEFRKKRNR